ncbi:AIM24 family protein [Sanguibacter suaedae]|uniref:AIM24 family protein n=1 Tax=Sanguibacter suaedae TaxID=2795737 RepID=A0A934M8E7_9MICO|nr:AIM24 family protein [Sanguibacter suaedae]MBI9113485.1 AIM24 family protein [Sanguibacter suaedae]
MSIQIHTPASLPSNDNVPDNDYAFSIELAGTPWFTSKGAMIAYYGTVQFEPLSRTSLTGLVASQFSSPLYANDWVIAQGHGKLILGDRGFNINSYDLDDANLTIRASNLLAFEPGLALKQSIVPGFVTLLGTGKFLASSNGQVMFAEPPLRIDPQALVGWADCPSPSHHFDAGWMHNFLSAAAGFFGMASGEERQFDFTGAGTVLIQSSEKVIDDAHLLRHIESETQPLSQASLQQLHRSIGARLTQDGY